jgi:hypothetical protein
MCKPNTRWILGTTGNKYCGKQHDYTKKNMPIFFHVYIYIYLSINSIYIYIIIIIIIIIAIIITTTTTTTIATKHCTVNRNIEKQ